MENTPVGDHVSDIVSAQQILPKFRILGYLRDKRLVDKNNVVRGGRGD